MDGASSIRGHAIGGRGGTRSERPGRLASLVVDELVHAIVGGTWSAGDVLPTEPVLCEEFGFSRTVIREALMLLEERGLVRVEQGRGTTVQPRDGWNLLDPVVLRIALEYDQDMSLLDDLMTVRRVLEREMAAAAASRLTEDDLASLRASIEGMAGSAAGDYTAFQVHDRAFHSVVMKASGNAVGTTIVRAIHRHGGIRPPLSAAATRAELAATIADHRGIYEALAARDGRLAAERISEHIDSAWAARKRRRRKAANAAAR
jgi:DNA-binding FadR family transcriptional regulator